MKMKKKVALLLAASMVFSALPAYGTGAEELIVPMAEESVEDLTAAVNAGDPGGTEVMDAADDGQGIIAEALPEEIAADDFTDGEGLAEDISDAVPTDVVAAADTDPANPADNAEAIAADAGSIPVPEADEPAAEAAIEAVLPDELTVETVEEVAAPEAEPAANVDYPVLTEELPLESQNTIYNYQFTPEKTGEYVIALSGTYLYDFSLELFAGDDTNQIDSYYETTNDGYWETNLVLYSGITYYFKIIFSNKSGVDGSCTLYFENIPRITKAELDIGDSCDIMWLIRNIDSIPLKLTYDDGVEDTISEWQITLFSNPTDSAQTYKVLSADETRTGKKLLLNIDLSQYFEPDYSSNTISFDAVKLMELLDNYGEDGYCPIIPLGRFPVSVYELSGSNGSGKYLCGKMLSLTLSDAEAIVSDEKREGSIKTGEWKAYSFTADYDSVSYIITVKQDTASPDTKCIVLRDNGGYLGEEVKPTALSLDNPVDVVGNVSEFYDEDPTTTITAIEGAQPGNKYFILIVAPDSLESGADQIRYSIEIESECVGVSEGDYDYYHKWDDGTKISKEDCEKKGIIEYKCTKTGCAVTKHTTIDPLGHDFATEFTTDVEPTCTTKGSKSRHCTREGCTATTEVTEIPMLAHTMTTVIDRQPTCTAVGKKHDECSVCHGNKQPSVDIPMAAHKMVEKRVEPTCAEPGMTYQICSVCGGNRTEPKEIPALAHTMAEKRVEPTCTAPGMTYQECSVCGGNRTEPVEIPALPHQMVTVVDAAPTCDADGSQHNECSVCKGNKSDFTVLPALGHKWMTVTDANPTCGGAGSQHDVCTVCAAVGPAVAIPATGKHVFGKYVTSKTPTALREGEEVRTCSVCGHKETRKIAALEPTIKTNAGNIPMQVGQSTSGLKVKGLAAGDSIKSWSSSRTSIVKVDQNGRLTAQHKVGSAVIVITLDSGHTKFVYVNVQKGIVKTQKITNVPSKLTIKKGKTRSLKPHLTPFTSQQKLTYKSSNRKVATVSEDGIITAVGPGTAKITVKSGKQKVTVRVTVPKIRTKKIRNVKKSVTLKAGGSFRLNPVTSPVNSDNKLTYSSSDKKIAAVSRKGRITAKKPGKAVITVKSGKIKKKCTVTVRRK